MRAPSTETFLDWACVDTNRLIHLRTRTKAHPSVHDAALWKFTHGAELNRRRRSFDKRVCLWTVENYGLDDDCLRPRLIGVWEKCGPHAGNANSGSMRDRIYTIPKRRDQNPAENNDILCGVEIYNGASPIVSRFGAAICQKPKLRFFYKLRKYFWPCANIQAITQIFDQTTYKADKRAFLLAKNASISLELNLCNQTNMPLLMKITCHVYYKS